MGDQAGFVGEDIQRLSAAGKDGFDSLLCFQSVGLSNPGGGDGVDPGQSRSHCGGDSQQGQSQTQDVQSGILLAHFLAASFLGAPNFTGRPIRSSSTTQQFITRMA